MTVGSSSADSPSKTRPPSDPEIPVTRIIGTLPNVAVAEHVPASAAVARTTAGSAMCSTGWGSMDGAGDRGVEQGGAPLP
jgi:hypothetical protein